MKKILSILVMVLFGVSSVWAVDATLTVTINTEVRSTPTDVNGVIVSQVCKDIENDECGTSQSGWIFTASADKPDNERCWPSQGTETINKRKAEFNSVQVLLKGKCFLSTEYVGDGNAYVFSHWEASNGVTINTTNLGTSGECDFTIIKTQGDLFNLSGSVSSYVNISYTLTAKSNLTEGITFTAVWVQPDVTGVAGGTANGTRQSTYSLGTITNPTQIDKNIVFTLSNDYAGLKDIDGNVPANYYSISTPLNSNGYTNGAMSHTKGSGSLIVPVTYTPTGVHNQTNSASLVVKSNYPSNGDNSWTAVLNVKEDYKPSFTLDASSYNFTPTQPLANNAVGTYTLPISGRNYAASNIAEWGVTWSAVTYDGETAYPNTNPYSVDVTDINNPKVIFTAPATGSYTDVTATLTITAKYKDANGILIASDPKTIIFSADAGEALTINDGNEYTMDFGVIDFGMAYTDEVELISTSSDLDESVNNQVTGIAFNVDVANEKVVVSIANTTAIGDHVPSLTLSKGALSVVLNVKAQVKLAKPIVTPTTGLGQSIDLSWSAVEGATSYIVKSGETVVATIEDPAITTFLVDNIGGKPLVMGTEYPFTVTAVYEPNAFGNRTSDEIKAKATAPTDINSLTEINIYTGTEKAGAYPYHKDGKRLVDLSAAFKDDKAIFDQLFIFGLTTGDANNNITKPTATTNSNAVTPCYIYTKSGNNYTLSKTISNVNVETKPTEFNITDMSKSYYFTGYAPYASCGSTWEENAVFLFTSSGNSVNLYFDNLELYARPKAATGNKVPTKTYTANDIKEAIGLINDPDIKLNISPLELYVYVQGSGAAFAFASTSTTAFQPTIHLRGKNVLESTAGATVHVTSTLLSLDASAAQVSSPIQVLLKKDGGMNSKTTLTITDIWVDGITHTNGILDLANLDVRPAPTIDLGNANTTLNINGGQYFLSNAANTSISYTVSYAISYRKKSMAGDKAQMFGLGDDQPEGKVRFKDGSINCSVLPKNYFNENLYHNQTSMKCPKDTKIDGGTFNCDVLACTSTTSKGGSPTNTAGQALCMVGIPIKSVDNANGTAILEADWMEYAAANGANTDQLDYYGIKSMTPITITDEDENETQVVNLLLPSDKVCFMEVVRIPWVLCTPSITINQSGMSEALGGNELVQSSITEGAEGLINVVVTSRLLYAEMDDITKAAVDNYQTPGGYKVEIGDNNRQYITNEDSYVVKDKIYWVRPIIANEWQMVVPPFDVANIYVVEAYPEAQLLADFGDGKKIADEDQISAARTAQAKRMMDFFYYWLYDADPAALGNDNDLWPNKGWDMSKFMREWVDYEVETYGDAYKPIIDQLYHFTGNNWDANYYLYETDGVWDYSFDGENDKFTTDWTPVQTQSVQRGKGTPQTIMHKGGVYSICFPYSIFNTEHDPYTEWDYWTGKYIIMEGYPTEEDPILGPVQVLSGTETDWDGVELTSTVLADFTNVGQASLRGNYTFGQLPVQKENAFYLNGNRYTPRAAKHTLEPSQGFLLANDVSTLAGMPRRIKTIDLMSGEVTYEEGEGSENGATGTPTIAGNNKMLVYNINGGVGIVPVVAQQVSIYNAAGQVVTSEYLAGETQLSLPAGIYLVCGEYEQYKVLVK